MKLIIFTGFQQLGWQAWLEKQVTEQALPLYLIPFQEALKELDDGLTHIIKKSSQPIVTSCTLEQLSDHIDKVRIATNQYSIDLKIIGLYAEPKRFLIHTLNQALGAHQPTRLDSQISLWQNQAEDLLKFALDGTGQVHLANLVQNNQLLTLLNGLFDTESQYNSELNDEDNNTRATVSSVLVTIVQQASLSHPELTLIYEQLEAFSDHPASTEQSTPIDLEQNLEDLFNTQAECNQNTTLTKQLLGQHDTEKQLFIMQLQHLEQELESRFTDSSLTNEQLTKLTAQQEQLLQERDQLRKQLDACTSDKHQLSEENDLALLQIQQLQEELESTFTAMNTSQSELDEQKVKQTTIEQERDQLRKQLDACTSDKHQLSEENDLALLQIQQLQEELESTFTAMNTSQSELDEQKVKQTTIEQERDQLRKQLDACASDKHQLSEENDLALLQIQQLQEELESTFTAMNTSQSELDEQKVKQTTIEQERDQLRKQLDACASDKHQLSKENDLALLQIQQLQEELESVYVYSQQQEQTLGEKEAHCVSLAQAKQQLTLSCQDLEDKNHALQNELAQSLEKLQALVEEKAQWQSKYQEFKQVHQQTKDSLSELQHEHETLQQQNQVLEQQHSALNAQLAWQVINVSSKVAAPLDDKSLINDFSVTHEIETQSVAASTPSKELQSPSHSESQDTPEDETFTPLPRRLS